VNPGSHAQLPRRVRRRLDESAEAWLRACADSTDDLPPVIEKIVVDRKAQRRGWYAAAACLVLAIAGWWPRLAELGVDAANGISPLQAEVERGRESLLKTGGAQLGRWGWSHESGVAAKVHGEVIWDGARQQGYITLGGLQPNAETGRQYQLWIFDGTRDDRYPVDGGVFDVPPGDQSVTIPIRPSLRVTQPLAFAVTLEPAGGVVVSDRQHLMALARAGTR
jgi:Anti-sigma-K factor rskA